MRFERKNNKQKNLSLMITNFRTKVQKLPNGSLGTLAIRVNESVQKSGIAQAQNTKQFTLLSQVNGRYQALIKPKDQKEISDAVKQKYEMREQLLKKIGSYCKGLINSPDEETKLAAIQVNKILTGFGGNLSRMKLAEQAIRYIRIIEMLKSPELADSIQTLKLTDVVVQLDALQREYESHYTGRGDERAGLISASNLRRELVDAIVEHYEECCWMAKQNGTDEWKLLAATIERRLTEIYTYRSASTDTETTEEGQKID